MGTVTKMRLRDRREPGHFWADNEIIDVFGDELGQNGISVYMTMTRFCYGAEVRLSLREIAAAARMSKDTVARSMKVLVSVGLVIETKGAKAKTVSTWSLANVKALVQSYVRQSAPRTVSQGDRLVEAKTQESVSAARHSTLVEIVKEQRGNCLTVRQSGSEEESVDKKFCVAQDATDLSQNEAGYETDLSQSEGSHLYSKTQDTKLQDNNPLPPSQANGDCARMAGKPAAKNEMPACEEAVRKVMRELNLTERRMVPVIAHAIESYRAKTDDPPNCNAVAEMMVKARHEYLEHEELLKFQVGVRKFFAHGIWADPRQWVFDHEKYEESSRRVMASLGTYRP